MREQRHVAIGGVQSRSGPLTWAQHHIIDSMTRGVYREHPFPNVVAVVADFPVSTVAAACDVVSAVLHRHEALRTRYVLDRGEQHLRTDDSCVVTVVPAALDVIDEIAARECGRLRGEPLYRSDRTAAEFTLVTCDDMVHRVVLGVTHLSVDRIGVATVAAELQTLLRGGTLDMTRPRIHPLDCQEWEDSAPGRRHNARALEHWRRIIETAPATSLHRRHEPAGRTWYLARTESRELHEAALRISSRCGVAMSAPIIAAFSLVLGLPSGTGHFAYMVTSLNRFDSRYREAVASVSQAGLCRVSLGSATFDDHVRDTHSANIRGYRYGKFDKRAEVAQRDRIQRERGVAIEMGIIDVDDVSAAEQGGEPPVPDDSRAGDTRVETREVEPVSRVIRYQLQIKLTAHSVGLALNGDGRVFSRHDIGKVVTDMRDLLVRAASGTYEMSALRRDHGAPDPTTDPDLVVVDNCLVSLADTYRALTEIVGTDTADLATEPDASGGAKLVFSFVKADAPAMVDLHRQVVDDLQCRGAVRAPDWYVRHQGAVAGPAGASWQTTRVLEAGSGRPTGAAAPTETRP